MSFNEFKVLTILRGAKLAARETIYIRQNTVGNKLIKFLFQSQKHPPEHIQTLDKIFFVHVHSFTPHCRYIADKKFQHSSLCNTISQLFPVPITFQQVSRNLFITRSVIIVVFPWVRIFHG